MPVRLPYELYEYDKRDFAAIKARTDRPYRDQVDFIAEATGYPWEARVTVCRSDTTYGPGFIQSYLIDRPYERYGEFWVERTVLAMLIAWRRNGGRWIGNAIGGAPFPTNEAITAMLNYLPLGTVSQDYLSSISYTIKLSM